MQIISAVNVPLSRYPGFGDRRLFRLFCAHANGPEGHSKKCWGCGALIPAFRCWLWTEDASGATDIASFWLSAIEPEARPGIVYAITVGTRIAHRRKGLAQQLYKRLAPRAREAQLDSCLLEVIDGNDKAVELL